MTVLFDDYGYVDADLVCAGLPHRENNKECVAGWIGRSMKLLKDRGYEFEDFYCYSKARGGESLQSAMEKCRYPLIGYYDVEKDRKAYVVTKDGLVLLARAAKMIGHKIAEADSLLAELGVEDNEPVIVAKRTRGKSKPKAESPKSEPPKVILDIEVDPIMPTVVPTLEPDDSEDGEVDLQTSDRELMTIESFPEALTPDVCQSYIWKQGGKPIAVTLSSQYASICKMRTAELNRRIRVEADRGSLVEGIDFITLTDKNEISAFSVINEVDFLHLTSRKNLYLLTTIGVAHLAMHLRNAQAKAQQDYAASSAVVVHNLENNKLFMAQSEKIAELEKSYVKLALEYEETVKFQKEMGAQLVMLQQETGSQLVMLQKETGSQLEKILNAVLDNTAIASIHNDIQAISTDLKAKEEVFTTTITETIDNVLSEAKTYRDNGSMPADLISYAEIRRLFLPGISESRIPDYLIKAMKHPTDIWYKLIKGSLKEKVTSPCRAGLAELAAHFFSRVKYLKATPQELHFSQPDIGYAEIHLDKRNKETWHFLMELIRHNPAYHNWGVEDPKTMEFKPKVEPTAWPT